jgi:hypothetical protein
MQRKTNFFNYFITDKKEASQYFFQINLVRMDLDGAGREKLKNMFECTQRPS